MADVHSKEIRSYTMSRVKSKNTTPEMLVRKFLHKNGFRYRLHVKGLSGKPDIVLPKYNTAIFVHGCFWHGHNQCSKNRRPKSNIDYWDNKVSYNIAKDKVDIQKLQLENWKVLVIWECQLSNSRKTDALQGLIENILN